MKRNIKGFIRKYLWWIYRPVLTVCREWVKGRYISKDTQRLYQLQSEKSANRRIYYIGIPAHSNLGDMAQYYCIKKWIKDNYTTYDLVMFECDTVVNNGFGFIEKFKTLYCPEDIIVFQSGYTTQDLGGNHEYMHRLIIDNIPDARILMMPQTIFFKYDENKKKTAISYDKARHMLFLARDFVSFDMAKEMFPHQTVKAFPDIVTTLIGTLHFNNKRKGICMCRRDDGEKFYSEDKLLALKKRLKAIDTVYVTDTTINQSYRTIRCNLQHFIEGEIEKYSYYKVMITDRYHGTIFSLAAGTPVIILKTTDHKVTTGADWFKGVYDDYVYVANNLDDAYEKAVEFSKNERPHDMKSYFKENYYDKLKDMFESL